MSAPALPAAAAGPEIPAGGFYREELGEGVHYLTDGVYQSAFVVTAAGVVVIDAPPVLAAHLLPAIQEVTDKPITDMIYTHSHTDHIGAAHMFPVSGQLIAHETIATKLAVRADQRRPAPTRTFTAREEIEIGGVRMTLDYPGPNHEVGNIFVALPAARVIVAVDIVFPGWVPFGKVAHSDDIPGWVAAHDALLARDDWDVLVAGHLGRVGAREEVEVGREYAQDLLDASRRSFTEAVPAAAAKPAADQAMEPKTELDPWAAFRGFFDTLTDYVVEQTTPKWEHRLGGWAFHRDNALGFVEAVAVEFSEK